LEIDLGLAFTRFAGAARTKKRGQRGEGSEEESTEGQKKGGGEGKLQALIASAHIGPSIVQKGTYNENTYPNTLTHSGLHGR
jgi:hypothetical protein